MILDHGPRRVWGLRLALAIAGLLLVSSCGDDSTIPELDHVDITPSIDTLAPGDGVQLHATFFDHSGDPVSLRPVWTATGGAQVTPAGFLTAQYGGSASVTASQPGPVANVSRTLPLTIQLPTPLVMVAVGWNSACALDGLGIAYCWGDNSVSELGSPDVPVALGPARVQTTLKFAKVVVGGSHACGLTSAGAAYCWGFNLWGQVGTGDLPAGCGSSCIQTPTPVSGTHQFATLTAGTYHTCGLTPDGSAYCWGDGTEGKLGNGTVAASPEDSPQAVLGSLHFKSISAGEFHTCAVTLTGAAYCWGANPADQLGIGPTDQSPRSSPTAVAGGLVFDSIVVGSAHSCALTSTGAAYCWGIDRGQLGYGTSSLGTQNAPIAVTGGHAFVQLVAGTDQTCGLVAAGEAYCWGSGPTTGTGAPLSQVDAAPAPVNDTLTFAQLAASKATCGITVSHLAYCWGPALLLGTPDTSTANRPRRVAGQP